MAATFPELLAEVASRRAQDGSAGVRPVADALLEYAALLPASASNVDRTSRDAEVHQATCSGRLAEACTSMLSSTQVRAVAAREAQLCLSRPMPWRASF